MISPVDVLCVAIMMALVALEGNRGVVPAAVDFICILLGVILIRMAYVPLSDYMRPSSAYLLLLIALVVLAALLSIYVSRRLNISITAFEAAIGALLGLGTAMFLCHAIFQWISIRYGSASPLIQNSVLGWMVLDFAGFQEFVNYLRTLTGR